MSLQKTKPSKEVLKQTLDEFKDFVMDSYDEGFADELDGSTFLQSALETYLEFKAEDDDPITTHARYEPKDYKYLKAKGYTDEDIVEIWNRDVKNEKEKTNENL